ncbi:MAG: hypothetical protein AAGF20_01015 [Pseudomonadota bacterium]
MSGPWEKYSSRKSQQTPKPWEKYQQSVGDTLQAVDSVIGQIDDLTEVSLHQQMKQRYPGANYRIEYGSDGTPRINMFDDPMALVESDARARRENEQIADDIKWNGRVAAVVNGATFGFGDEIYSALGSEAKANAYVEGLSDARANRPGETMALEVLGGIPSGVGMARATAPVISTAKRPGASAAVTGGVYGFGDGQGNALARLDDTLVGAAAGGLLGKTLDEGVNVLASLRQAGQPAPSVNANEFGIRMTRGQTTNNLEQIAFEQAAARGGRSPEARQVMRPFMDDQRQAVTNAGKSLAGDNFAEINDAGAFVAEGLKRRASEAQENISSLYEKARSYKAQLKAEGVKAMPDAVRDALPEDVRFLMDAPSDQARVTMPAAMQAMDAIKRLRDEAAIIDAGTKDASLVAVDFRRIEIARRAINSSIDAASNASDRSAALSVKRAFDDYIDGAVDAALFEGDDAFINAYKTARAARADFADKFETNKVYEKLIKLDASPEQTLEYILGANKIAPTDRVRQVVPQMRRALGPNSEEWAALQEAAIKRVMKQTERTYNPKVLRDNLYELLRGRNQSVAQELFTTEQYEALRRFSSAVGRLVPPDGAVNTSGTAYDLRRMLEGEANNIFSRVPGGRTIGAMVQKYLPDRDLSRARAAVSDSAQYARPRTYLPKSVAPVTGMAGSNALLNLQPAFEQRN